MVQENGVCKTKLTSEPIQRLQTLKLAIDVQNLEDHPFTFASNTEPNTSSELSPLEQQNCPFPTYEHKFKGNKLNKIYLHVNR